MILFKKGKNNKGADAQADLRLCWSQTPKTGFHASRPAFPTVFGYSNWVRPKQACPATETTMTIEILQEYIDYWSFAWTKLD